jgi:ligand-binding sensor domain-containing protein
MDLTSLPRFHFRRNTALVIFLLSVLLSSCDEDKEATPFADAGKWIHYSTDDVTRFDGESFEVFTTADGLRSNYVSCILQDRDNDLLIGTSNGLSIFRDGEWNYIPALDGATILALMEDDLGRLWLGSYEYGILLIEDGTLYQFYDNGCVNCNNINSIIQTSDKRIWFGTDGGLKALDDDTFTLYTEEDGLTDDGIYTLEEDEWGALWLGSRQGTTATRYYQGEFGKVSLRNDASSLWITSITKGRPGELWFGTVAYGLVRYDGVVMREVYEGPSDDTITKIYKDKRGNMWLGTFESGITLYLTK